MNFIESTLKKRTLLSFFLLVIILGGFSVFQGMSKLEDPEIPIKQAIIYTMYPGASPEEVENKVTDIIEKSIKEMGEVDDIDSRSMPGVSEIKVTIKKTVRSHKVQQVWDMLRRKVEKSESYLPANAKKPMVLDDFGDVFGLFYAISSDGYSYKELGDYADLIQKELLHVDGVRRVNLFGKRQECVNIKFSINKMHTLGIHPGTILQTLNSQNKVYNSGNINVNDERIRIDFRGDFKTMKDIENMVIKVGQNDQIRLKDVADIEKGYVEPYRNLMKHNQQDAVGMGVSMVSGYNVIELGKNVSKRVEELKQQIPVGIEINPIFYQPQLVDDSISNFMINLLESILIVVLVLMLAVGLRGGLIVSSGLIFTILATIIVLGMVGGTIQRVSLASFIIAMGMLVDNAIVVFEGIIVDLKRGVKRDKAMVNTPMKTAKPLLGATLIATLAFMPIFMSKDSTGEFAKDLFVVIAASLLLSWLLALIQTPYFTDLFYKINKKKFQKQVGDDGEVKDIYDTPFYNWFKKIYIK